MDTPVNASGYKISNFFKISERIPLFPGSNANMKQEPAFIDYHQIIHPMSE
jgi:hypothetical protein